MKLKPNIKKSKIILSSIAGLFSVAMIVGDYFAYKYSDIISTFFGVAEQLGGDTEVIEQSAKSSDEVVRRIAEEGTVLMKNKVKDGVPTLPLSKDQKNINVFGWGATDAGFLLTGNGSGRSYIYPDNKVTFLQGLKDADFNYNEEIIQIYEDWCTTEDADWGDTANWGNRYNTKLKEPVTESAFPEDVVNRAKEFSDTAVIVLSRYSGEYIGNLYDKQYKHDLPTDETRSFNEISTEEESLIKMCTANFDKVIVVFNTGSIMDMTFIDDEANFGEIDAALNVGYMGQSGATAIGRILHGEISPSGKLADTIVYEPEINEITRVNSLSNDIVYAEDIYLGYKYYETADSVDLFEDKVLFDGTSSEKTGYNAVVQYPFGHGLSYTNFEWELEELSLPEDSFLTSDSEIEIKVTVTNKGEMTGKDVVELYLTAPYTSGGIEKSYVTLIDFAKTPDLEPNQSYTATFNITPYQLASYDTYDANSNDLTGWEVEAGDYQLKLMTDAHHLKEMNDNTITYKVEESFRYRKDPVSGGRVKNRFSGEEAYGGCALDGSTLNVDWTYLSRADMKNTLPVTKEEAPDSREISQYATYVYEDYVYDSMPTTNQDSDLRLITKDDGSFLTYDEFNGVYDGALKYNEELMMELGNPDNFDSAKWDTFLNQMSITELKRIVEDGGYGSRAIESLGKNINLEYDGPSGFNRTNLSPNVPGSNMTALPCENLVGQTWSKELLYLAGQILGRDAQNFGLSGIYAPGVNLHREINNGRNYEYYSEDGVLSGFYAAYFIKGAASNGLYCYVKHLALYDSSPYTQQRVWCTEQNFRENYLRPFEIAVKEGKANAMMVSFNKIGPTWAGSNQALLDGILRDEWGFRGTIITDYDAGDDSNMDLRKGIRAGLNLQLNPQYGKAGRYGTLDSSDTVDMNLARSSAKSIIYTICNTYYQAKTNTDSNEFTVTISNPKAIKKGFNWWVPVVVVINVIIFGVFIFSIIYFFIPDRKKKVLADGVSGQTDNSEKKKKFFSFIHKPISKSQEISKLKQEIEEKDKRIKELEDIINHKE